MDWDKFEKDLQNCRFEFSEDQLRQLKLACTEMYKILKFVFDSPRKLIKPYTSLEDYKFRKERMYSSPSDFYHYRDNEVEIKLWKRRHGYSVAVFGAFIPEGINFSQFIGHEKKFAQGYTFYGLWPTTQFYTAVYTFNYVVRMYINHKMDNEALF